MEKEQPSLAQTPALEGRPSFMPEQTEMLPGLLFPTVRLQNFMFLTLGLLTLVRQVYVHSPNKTGYCDVETPELEPTNDLFDLVNEPRSRTWTILYLAPTRVLDTTFFLEACAKRIYPDYELQSREEKQVSLVFAYYDFKHYNSRIPTVLQYVIGIASAFTLVPYVRFVTILVLEKHIVIGSSTATQAAVLMFSASTTQAGLQFVSWACIPLVVLSLILLSRLRRTLKSGLTRNEKRRIFSCEFNRYGRFVCLA